MIIGKGKNNDLTTRDRLGRLEGQMNIVTMLVIGNFLAVMGLLLTQAFG